MSIVRRIIRIASVVILGVAATGCIVLPYGGHHDRRGHGDRYYSGTTDGQPDSPPPSRDRHGYGRR